VYGALGDPVRLQIVSRLCRQGPLSVTKLTSATGITRQAVSKHLQVLEQAGLVRSYRQGRTRISELEAPRLEAAHRDLELISSQWDRTLSRLRKLVES
jgi:DNA-binding transcriptional ArsR family regulator